MRVYMVNLPTRVFTASFCLVISFLEINIIFDEKISFPFKIVAILGISIFVSIIYLVYANRIVINDKMIEEFFIPITFFFGKKNMHKKQSISWNEVEELRATYVLYPESPIINLIPLKDVKKKPFSCLIGGVGMDLDLLKDILSHLSPSAKVYLYPHLEKMLQRKPDSKRKVIVIASVLIFILSTGFLLSWFDFNDVAIILSIIVIVGIAITTGQFRIINHKSWEN